MIIYGQRTADGRFAFGGRGAPYHYGSRMRPGFERVASVHEALHADLREMFPAIGDAAITHRWGGAVAAARDWWCSARFDRTTGLASAGGYVGDGVVMTAAPAKAQPEKAVTEYDDVYAKRDGIHLRQFPLPAGGMRPQGPARSPAGCRREGARLGQACTRSGSDHRPRDRPLIPTPDPNP